MRLAISILTLVILRIPSFGQDSKDSILRSLIEKDINQIGLANLNSSSNIRTYRIWLTYQQVIELSELPNLTYEGFILNYINRITGRGKRERNELIIQRAPIPKERIRDLMSDLYVQNIEVLPDDDEIEDYPDGFDGTSIIFEIKTSKTHRFYSYWEPMNDRYSSEQAPEVANVRNIIRTLNAEFNLWEYFKKFRDRLPSGSYSYGGIQMIKL